MDKKDVLVKAKTKLEHERRIGPGHEGSKERKKNVFQTQVTLSFSWFKSPSVLHLFGCTMPTYNY